MGCHVAENQLVPAIELESMVAQESNPAKGVMKPGEKDFWGREAQSPVLSVLHQISDVTSDF